MNAILYISVTICLLGSVFDGSDALGLVPFPRIHFFMKRSAPLEDKVLRECIMEDLNCPADGSIDFRRNRIVYKMIQSLDLPDRCSCDLSEKRCLRGCFYNYLVKYSVMYAAWSALVDGRDAEKAKQRTVKVMEYLKRCQIEGEGCNTLIGRRKKPADLAAKRAVELAKLRALVDMPSDCECDIETDTCARRCYYSVAKKYQDAGIGKTN